MKDIQFPDSSFIGAGTSRVLWGGHTTVYNCNISLAKIQCFFSPIKIKKILYSKLKGWNLPKMPNESKTRYQIQKKSQITKTVFLQLKNKVDLQIPVIYLTF